MRHAHARTDTRNTNAYTCSQHTRVDSMHAHASAVHFAHARMAIAMARTWPLALGWAGGRGGGGDGVCHGGRAEPAPRVGPRMPPRCARGRSGGGGAHGGVVASLRRSTHTQGACDHANLAAGAPPTPISRPSFCRAPPGVRSIHPHTRQNDGLETEVMGATAARLAWFGGSLSRGPSFERGRLLSTPREYEPPGAELLQSEGPPCWR